MTLQVALDGLATTIPDGVLRPGDPGYAEAVTTMTGAGTPDLVVRPRSTTGVVAAVRFAREYGLPLTVRSGGHSVAGLTTVPDGMLLDLRLMHEVDVAPAGHLVRIDGGACWGRVARALQPHGLGLTAGDTQGVGVGGLTLGGGIGWMVRRHGLAIDNLVGAEVVTADGQARYASATENPDLFWALRGGGGGLGVVTRFDFVAQPIGDVVFGTVVFALDDPGSVLASWRDAQRGADERLTTSVSLAPARGDQPAMATLGLCFAGPEADAADVVGPLMELGPLISSDVSVRPYAEVLEDTHGPAGMRITMRNAFLPDLGAAELSALEAVFRRGGTMLSLRALGGAAARVAPDATAFAHRFAEVMAVAMRLRADDAGPGEDDIPGWASVADRGTGSYVNFLSESADATAGYPFATIARLARIKAAYDPDNLFRRGLVDRAEGTS